MGRFVNSETGVVVSVADDKDERFSGGLWSAEGAEKKTSTRKAPAKSADADK